MSRILVDIFKDEKLVAKIKRRLPYLFSLAELESSRAGNNPAFCLHNIILC